jgi:hypothetical protein
MISDPPARSKRTRAAAHAIACRWQGHEPARPSLAAFSSEQRRLILALMAAARAEQAAKLDAADQGV